MSVIVAVEKARRVAVAWDTMTSVGSTRCVNATGPPKVVRAGSNYVGSAGLTVYRNILEHYLRSCKLAALRDEVSVFDFFIGLWRTLHRRYHLVNDQSDVEASSPFADLDSEFLVASPHGIFRVKEILSVSRFERFCAVGSGAPHAEGALAVLYDARPSARVIAEQAVAVALKFDAACGGNISTVDFRAARSRSP